MAALTPAKGEKELEEQVTHLTEQVCVYETLGSDHRMSNVTIILKPTTNSFIFLTDLC